jgi:hypothetical protein
MRYKMINKGGEECAKCQSYRDCSVACVVAVGAAINIFAKQKRSMPTSLVVEGERRNERSELRTMLPLHQEKIHNQICYRAPTTTQYTPGFCFLSVSLVLLEIQFPNFLSSMQQMSASCHGATALGSGECLLPTTLSHTGLHVDGGWESH